MKLKMKHGQFRTRRPKPFQNQDVAFSLLLYIGPPFALSTVILNINSRRKVNILYNR